MRPVSSSTVVARPRTACTVREIARGNPSITVSAVENIVVSMAAMTMGRVHAPSVWL